MEQAAANGRDGLLDRITYLASLVSNKNDIEPYLDELRLLTSGLPGNGPDTTSLTPSQYKTLTNLERELKRYLIEKEPLRSFSAESLEQQLYERFNADTLIRRLRWQLAAIIGGAIGITVITVLLPAVARTGRQSEVAGPTFIAVMYFGAVYLFLAGLKRFSPALQSIYRIFGLGFVLGACTVLINLTVTLSYGAKAPWDTLWFVNLGLPLSYIAIYIASSRLAKLQNVQTAVLPWPWVGVIAIIAALAISALPHGRDFYPVDGFAPWFTTFNLVYTAIDDWVLYKAWKQSSERYKYSTRALTASTLFGLFGWVFMTFRTFVTPETATTFSNLSDLCTIVALIMLIRAGYMLNKLSRE